MHEKKKEKDARGKAQGGGMAKPQVREIEIITGGGGRFEKLEKKKKRKIRKKKPANREQISQKKRCGGIK